MAAGMSTAIWGKPFSRELFREDPNGEIEINLIYDYRQEASDKLKKLNLNIDKTKTSYDNLKVRLDILKKEYDQRNFTLANNFNAYNSRINAFNRDVAYWKGHGGVPESVQQKLTQEMNELNPLRETLKIEQDDLQRSAETMNSMVVVINDIANSINLDVTNYNNAGNELGREFCEGLYEYKNGKQTISIYQFDNDYRLVRVLTHEFGHALGLKHSNDAKAVMYRLIQSDSLELGQDDITAVKARCGI
jgi:predicted Zn-dependent protease